MRERHPTIVTHDGKFHADDVFAAAALLLFLKGDAEVLRTRDREKIKRADFVIDVGGEYAPERNRFDHHQKEGAGARENGLPFAAFGLVWKHLGEKIAGGSDAAKRVDTKLVQPLDAYDNGVALFSETAFGVYPYELSAIIQALNPSWRENQEETEERFHEAVLFAEKLILREIEAAQAESEARGKVEEAVKNAADARLVVLNEDLPWKETLARFSAPLFVVHPQEKQWFVECVRDNPSIFVNRKDLPESWAGLRDEECVCATGVPDAVFCHRNRFMAVTRSREGAIQLAQKALAS